MIIFKRTITKFGDFIITIVLIVAVLTCNVIANSGSTEFDGGDIEHKRSNNTNYLATAVVRNRNKDKLSAEYGSMINEANDGRNLLGGRNGSGIYNYFHPGSENGTHLGRVRQKRNAVQSNEDLFEFMVRIANTPTEWERIRRVLSRIKYDDGDQSNRTLNETNDVKKNNYATSDGAVIYTDRFKNDSDLNRTNSFNVGNRRKDDNRLSSPSFSPELFEKKTVWPSNRWIKLQDETVITNMEKELSYYDDQQELNFYDDNNEHNNDDVIAKLETVTEQPRNDKDNYFVDEEFEDYLSEENNNKYNVVSSVPMDNSPFSNDTFQLKVYKHIGPPNLIADDNLNGSTLNEYDSSRNNNNNNNNNNDNHHSGGSGHHLFRKNRKRHHKKKKEQRESME